MMKIHNPFLIFIVGILFFLLYGVEEVFSQTAHYKYKVVEQDKKNPGKPIEGKPVRYGHYIDFNEAQRIFNELKKKKEENFSISRDDYNDYSIQSASNGLFEFDGANGMGVIIITQNLEILLIKHTDGKGNLSGKTDDDINFSYTIGKDGERTYTYDVMIHRDQFLDEAIKTSKAKGSGNRSRSFNYNDGYEHFEYSLRLPAGYHEESSRIILLPYVVDCLTEDTIDYLPPAVYEGKNYHTLQDKRKDYDYNQVDPLGRKRLYVKHHTQRDTLQHMVTEERPEKDTDNKLIVIGEDNEGNLKYKMKTVSYMQIDSIMIKEWNDTLDSRGYICAIEDLEHSDGEILIDTIIHYKKPDKNATYRGVLKISMEDYHHQYFEKEEPGTCLRINPFKFLQMSTAAVDIPLSNEFYENAAETPIEAKEDLKIQFVHSKAEIIEDSLYIQQIAKLEREMHEVINLGGHLQSAEMVAFASPDGSDEINTRLAKNRAAAATQRIRVPGGTHVETRAVIDTWENTAELLDNSFHFTEAQYIRDALAKTSNKNAAYQEIRRCPTYLEVIKPVLESQCRVTFAYSFFTKKVMNAHEAVEAYYRDKHKAYSNGDYYNMFAELIARNDSLELDTLTQIAYDRIIKKGNNVSRRLAPYVINRMAVMGIRQGMPDSTILKPLIYENSRNFQFNYKKIDPSGILDDITCNRPEVILNQAVIFYLLQDPDRAKWYVDQLMREGYKNSALDRLNSYINFQKLYQIPENQRTPAEQDAFERALSFVENSSPDNKAVLYTEFEHLNKQSIAMEYVLQMKDSNPVKWYLMGLLWAKRDGKENDYPIEQYIADLSEEDNVEDVSLNIAGYPYYMAYFQKSFDVDASFAKHYFNEGNVDEQMRKKPFHAYKLSRIPVYHKIFALRKVADKNEHERLQALNKTIQERASQNENTHVETNKQGAENDETDE